MLFPNEQMFVFPLPVPIKAKYFVVGYAVIELLLGIADRPGDSIAHFAHLGTLGGPKTDSGIIDAPIARRELPSLLRYISPEGKPSVTEFEVLERTGECCLLSLRPITGRTHQLRLHCMHMGFPILGDPQYGTPESTALSREMGLTHQLLLAQSLQFNHPITGAPMKLTTSLPIK